MTFPAGIWWRRGAAVLLLYAASGCATASSLRNSGPEPVLYGGTRLDLDIAGAEEASSDTTRVCTLVDLPFSFVGDTALAPFQIGYWMFR